jgi:uncharacterized protein (DUF2236 family)
MPVLDRLLAPVADLMRPPPGLDFDFTQPAGEAALISPDSISWRIFKNPVTLFVGGVSAVILELAEPSVRSGVWDHSSFQKDPVLRLRRTGAAAMMTVYGPRSAAEKMIARVVRMHDRVHGTTPDGKPYHANDPRLLDWVQATASFGFIEAYARFASPLSDAEKSRAFAEAEPAARLYGAISVPRSVNEWHSMLDSMMPSLEPSDTLFEFLDIMRTAPIARSMRPVQRLLVAAAVEILPQQVRTKLSLEPHGLGEFKSHLIKGIARVANKLPIRTAPPAKASVRLGKSATYLYGGNP